MIRACFTRIVQLSVAAAMCALWPPGPLHAELEPRESVGPEAACTNERIAAVLKGVDPPPVCLDGDLDGMTDDKDHCPDTPKGTKAVALGCAALEIVARPQLIGGPVDQAIDVAFAALDDSRDPASPGEPARPDAPAAAFTRQPPRHGLFAGRVDHVHAALDLGRREMHRGLDDVSRGIVCGGADAVRAAETHLQSADSGMAAVVTAMRAELGSRVSPEDGDADALEVMFHELGYRAGLVGRAFAAMRDAVTAADAACAEQLGDLRVVGVVRETDDSARTMVLSSGLRLVLASNADAVTEGTRVAVTGVQFRGVSGVAHTLQPLPLGPIEAAPAPDLSIRCARLAVAPHQPSGPVAQMVMHDTRGYTADGRLILEGASRLGVLSGGCPASWTTENGRRISMRYSLRIEFKPDDNVLYSGVAWDLTASDAPVSLPRSAQTSFGFVSGTLRITEIGQRCRGTLTRGICSSPEVRSVVEVPVSVYATGTLGRAEYHNTLFEIEDWDTSHRAGVVTSVDPHDVLEGLAVSFSAIGRPVNGGAGTVAVTDPPGNPFFAVRHTDFIDGLLFPFATFGTVHRSGLIWPRIVGHRNGWPFWYTASLPLVVRDRIADCTAGPDTYYRLPWDEGVAIRVAQGNFGAFSHSGSQSFAFDFSLEQGQLIRAARGGVVEWLEDSLAVTFDPALDVSPTNPNDVWGNAVRIRHEDGTFSWYFHIRYHGVLVSVGQQVQRGQPIAHTGNTGRSSGPHLHYQVQRSNADWGMTMAIRFEDSVGTCLLPQQDDVLRSTNGNPNFP